ncbi:MAG: leucine-rich repeat protein [Saccharofermentans sp.]|nr:leucine-rich repeat protein [Saccharofermentans sp.]
MKKRLLCVLIVLVMVIGLLPCPVFASSVKSHTLQASSYGTFTSGADVISSMIKKHGEKGHPRIIMTNDKFAKLKSHLNDGSTTAKLLAKLKEEADSKKNSYINEPINYELVGGIRILEQSKRVQRRVATLALAYNIFGDEKYAKSCYAELENAANFPDWNPYHFLDTGEMCTAFAIGYDWLYNWMNDTQRNFLRKAMIEKGLNQVMKDYRGEVKFSETRGERGDGNLRSYVWYNSTEGDNWQYVCIGGTNMAALAIGDESDSKQVASDVLTYGYKKAYTSVRAGYKSLDGTFIEGLGYWDYATYYLGFISSSLKSTVGTDYGLVDHDGVRKSVDFVRCMSSNAPKSFSFGDDNDGTDTRWPVFLWLGENYKSRDMANVRLKKIAEGTGFDYLDVLWIDESLNTGTQNSSPDDWGGKNYSNASFRNTWDKSGLVAALHAGENNYLYHGHFDLGSFYVESNGTRFFTDLGNEKNYELNNRRNAYRVRTEGHNTLVINPSDDPGQPDKVTCLITAFQSGKEAYAVTDLTEAYKTSGAKRVVRGLKMIKDKKCVIVQDEISLNAAGKIYWFAHTKGSVSVASDGRSAVITVGSDKLWVGILSEGGKFTSMEAESLPSTPSVPGQSDNSEYRKLAIYLTNTKDTVISVACIPLKSGETKPSWIPSGMTDFGSSMSHYEHKMTEVAAKDPTCTENGNIRYWKCSVCGKLFSDAEGKNVIEAKDTVISALGHDLDHVKAKEPTDNEDGNIEYYVCKREGCGKKFADPEGKTELKDIDIIIPRKNAAVLGEEATVGNLIYRVTNPATDGTGTVTLIGVAVKTAGVSVPGTVVIKENTYTVNRIGPKAFYKNTALKLLTVGANVKIIDSYAFYGCKNLTKVYGGQRLETVCPYAFAYCSKLKSFNITSSVLKKISPYTFKKDKKLKTVKIKYTVRLTKAGVKKSLKGSSVKTVKVKKSKVKAYKKIFKKSNSGRTVRVKK